MKYQAPLIVLFVCLMTLAVSGCDDKKMTDSHGNTFINKDPFKVTVGTSHATIEAYSADDPVNAMKVATWAAEQPVMQEQVLPAGMTGGPVCFKPRNKKTYPIPVE